MAKKRLSPDAWIEAGLQALTDQGPSVLRAETLAREIGTTKGSFYWHFKDLPDFHAQLAGAWKRRAAASLVDALESKTTVAEHLQRIATTVEGESAMRAWAGDNASAAEQVTEIDGLRLNAVAAVLGDVGVSNPEIARALYATGVGLSALPDGSTANQRAMSTLIDLVLALR